jgi:histone H3/H4
MKRAYSSTIASMPKSIADLPLLNEEDDEDEERKDGEEEKKLVSVLLQLKAAKSTLNDSRKKKQRKKVIEEVTEKFVAQSQALITKHNKRWTAKVADMTLKCKKLKVQTEDILQKAKGCKKEFQESINLHQNKSKGLLDCKNCLSSIFYLRISTYIVSNHSPPHLSY